MIKTINLPDPNKVDELLEAVKRQNFDGVFAIGFRGNKLETICTPNIVWTRLVEALEIVGESVWLDAGYTIEEMEKVIDAKKKGC